MTTKWGEKPKVEQDLAAVQLFASLLLPAPCPEGSVAHLFGLPSKTCGWHDSAATLSSAAGAMDAGGDDVYVGVSLRRVGLGKVSRGSAEDCTHALGVGIDIDVGVDGHGGSKKRFSTVEAALDCAAGAVALPPTMIVHSGGGLHLWWLYREPFELASAADRNLASNVAREWNLRIATAALALGGYSVDSTFDLARVLRVPGTRNRKMPDHPRLVRLLEHDAARRYDPSDLADALGADPAALKKLTVEEATFVGEKLRLDPGAEPDYKKLHTLMSNDEKFAALLRRDAACSRWLKDTSASAFDLAIANNLVRCGWQDQEIVDLLIYNRRQHGNDLKLRENYYAKTIAKARQGGDATLRSAKDASARKEAAQQEEIEEVAAIPEISERRAEVLALLSKATGVDVVRIVSNGRDPARYRVHLRDGTVLHVDSTDKITRQRTWLLLAFEVNAKVPVDPLSEKNWRLLVTHMAQLAEFEPDGDSLSDALSQYLERAVDVAGDERDKRGGMMSSGRPILLAGGRAALHLPSFGRWLADGGRKTEMAQLKARLLALGFSARTLSYKQAGQGTSRTYWVAPGEDEGGRGFGRVAPADGPPAEAEEQVPVDEPAEPAN